MILIALWAALIALTPHLLDLVWIPVTKVTFLVTSLSVCIWVTWYFRRLIIVHVKSLPTLVGIICLGSIVYQSTLAGGSIHPSLIGIIDDVGQHVMIVKAKRDFGPRIDMKKRFQAWGYMHNHVKEGATDFTYPLGFHHSALLLSYGIELFILSDLATTLDAVAYAHYLYIALLFTGIYGLYYQLICRPRLSFWSSILCVACAYLTSMLYLSWLVNVGYYPQIAAYALFVCGLSHMVAAWLSPAREEMKTPLLVVVLLTGASLMYDGFAPYFLLCLGVYTLTLLYDKRCTRSYIYLGTLLSLLALISFLHITLSVGSGVARIGVDTANPLREVYWYVLLGSCLPIHSRLRPRSQVMTRLYLLNLGGVASTLLLWALLTTTEIGTGYFFVKYLQTTLIISMVYLFSSTSLLILRYRPATSFRLPYPEVWSKALCIVLMLVALSRIHYLYTFGSEERQVYVALERDPTARKRDVFLMSTWGKTILTSAIHWTPTLDMRMGGDTAYGYLLNEQYFDPLLHARAKAHAASGRVLVLDPRFTIAYSCKSWLVDLYNRYLIDISPRATLDAYQKRCVGK